jgi:plastocyanin
MRTTRRTIRPARLLLIAVAMIAMLALVGTAAGCATAKAQTCSVCGKSETPPAVEGSAEVVDGVQVVNIGVKKGFYNPNRITVAAGQPVTVVFSGNAEKCLAMPKFESLGKKADFTDGSASIDLGPLKPGTYEFTCGMGMTGGTITVE